MTVTYHVNYETGRALICRAEKQACPLKESDGKTPAEHFTDKSAAKKRGEEIMAKKHGSTKTLKKTKATSETKKATKKPVLDIPKGMTLTEARRIQEENFKLTTQHGQRIIETKQAPVAKESGKSDAVAARILDKNTPIDEKKKLLVEHISDPANYEKIREDFQKAGYDADTSSYVQSLRNGAEAGPNSILRQAQKDAAASQADGDNVSVSDVLIYAEEASDEYYGSYGSDRFSEIGEVDEDAEVDLDAVEDELPEFLKDDPDFRR